MEPWPSLALAMNAPKTQPQGWQETSPTTAIQQPVIQHYRNAPPARPSSSSSTTSTRPSAPSTDLRPLLQGEHPQLEGAHALVLEVGGVIVGLPQRRGVCGGRTDQWVGVRMVKRQPAVMGSSPVCHSRHAAKQP